MALVRQGGGDGQGVWQPAAALLEVLGTGGSAGSAPDSDAVGLSARHTQAAVTALVDMASARGASGAVPWLDADRAAARLPGDPSPRPDPAGTPEPALEGAGLARALARAALATCAGAEGAQKKGDRRSGAGPHTAAVRLLAALRCCVATATIGAALLCSSHSLTRCSLAHDVQSLQ